MKTKQQILTYAEDYNTKKYSTYLYDELIVKEKSHPDKMILMGAWKTGSIKEDVNGDIDESGKKYAFNGRWANGTSARKNAWEEVAKKIKTYKEEIPESFTKEEPVIVKKLQEIKGIGFIWTLFVLHCIYPTEYPLYDQHVYRAYKHLTSDGKKNPTIASNTWAAYTAYRNFFLNLLAEKPNTEYATLDRALWSFGKSVKICKRR